MCRASLVVPLRSRRARLSKLTIAALCAAATCYLGVTFGLRKVLVAMLLLLLLLLRRRRIVATRAW